MQICLALVLLLVAVLEARAQVSLDEHSARAYVRARFEADLATVRTVRPAYPFWQHLFTIPDGRIMLGSAKDGRLLATFPVQGDWARDAVWQDESLKPLVAGRVLPKRLTDRRTELVRLLEPTTGPLVHNPTRGHFLLDNVPALSEHHSGGVNVGRVVINGERLGGTDARDQYLKGATFARELRGVALKRYRDLYRTYGPRSFLYAEMVFGNTLTVTRLASEVPQAQIFAMRTARPWPLAEVTRASGPCERGGEGEASASVV